MTPQQALEVLYSASTLAPLPKKAHVDCEQAKVSLVAALEQLQTSQEKKVDPADEQQGSKEEIAG